MSTSVRVQPEFLDQAVKQALEDWANGDVRRAVNAAVKEAAKETARWLQHGGPYQSRTGRYKSGWDAKIDPRGYRGSAFHTETWTVYNRTDYQLTHLLENGHALRRGGRTYGHVRAFVHISPAEDVAAQLVISKISQKVGGLL